MKIAKKVLVDFLRKVKMEGKQGILECVLKFEKEGLKIDTNSPANLSRVMGWLNTSAFKEYEELGNVGINDFENVIKVLDRFGENIALKKEGNLLTISGEGKKVDIELISETFLSSDTGAPELEHEETFTITATKLKEIYKDVEMNKDAVLTVTTEEKKAKFSNTGKYKFLTEVEAPTCKGGTVVKFGEPLLEATKNFTGSLEFSVKTNYPAKVMEKTDKSVITVIVAPRVEDE